MPKRRRIVIDSALINFKGKRSDFAAGFSAWRASSQSSSAVEQRTHKPLVAGSIPASGTKLFLLSLMIVSVGAAFAAALNFRVSG